MTRHHHSGQFGSQNKVRTVYKVSSTVSIAICCNATYLYRGLAAHLVNLANLICARVAGAFGLPDHYSRLGALSGPSDRTPGPARVQRAPEVHGRPCAGPSMTLRRIGWYLGHSGQPCTPPLLLAHAHRPALGLPASPITAPQSKQPIPPNYLPDFRGRGARLSERPRGTRRFIERPRPRPHPETGVAVPPLPGARACGECGHCRARSWQWPGDLHTRQGPRIGLTVHWRPPACTAKSAGPSWALGKAGTTTPKFL